MTEQEKALKHWKQEQKLIPVMIGMYCRGVHRTGRGEVCPDCQALTEYALFRLSKCPFKEHKQFCAFCKIHCYKPEMRERIKAVMKYSGPRMLTTHPVFAVGHVVQLLRYKKQQKRNAADTEQHA